MPDPRSPPRFRRRLLKVVTVGLLVGCLLASLPVPVGWLLRTALARSTEGTDLVATLEGATLRWRWGEAALQLELRDVRIELRQVPLLKAKRVRIDVDKRALFERRVPPVALLMDAPDLTFDARSAGRLTTLPPASTGRRAFMPASWERLVPRSGESFHVQVRNGRATVMTDTGPWQTSCATATLEMGRKGEAATVTMEWISSDEDWHGRLDAIADPHTGLLEFLLKTDPGVVRWPGLPPAAVSALNLRGGGEGFGRTWWCQLANDTPRLAGVQVSQLRCEVDLGPPAKISWDFEVSASPATVLDNVGARSLLPLVAATACDRLQAASVRSSGSVVLEPGPKGGWRSRSLRAHARTEGGVSEGESVVASMMAEQRENADRVETSFTMTGLNPARWLGPPVPDIGLVIEAHAGWSREGSPLDGRLEVRADGPGRWRHTPMGDLPLDELVLRLRVDAGASEIHVEAARLRASAAQLDLTEGFARRASDGTWEMQAVLNAKEVPGGAWFAAVPILAAKARESGFALDPLAVRTGRFALKLGGMSAANPLAARVEAKGAARLAWGQADFTVEANATSASSSGAVDVRLVVSGVRPSLVPAVGRPAWAQLDLPLDLTATAQVDLSQRALLAAQLNLIAGPGTLHDQGSGGSLAIKEVRGSASLGLDGRLRIVNARFECGAAPLWIQAEDVEVWTDDQVWRSQGRIAWSEVRSDDVWLAWTEGMQPKWREEARARIRAARIEAGALAFKLRSGDGLSGRQLLEGLVGSVVLHDTTLLLPADSGEMRADRVELRVDYPKADLLWEQIHCGSVSSPIGHLRLQTLDDLPRADWSVELRIAGPSGASGAKVEASNLPIVGSSVADAGTDATVPAARRANRDDTWLEGPIVGELSIGRLGATKWRATSVVDLSRATCRVPAGQLVRAALPLLSPAPLRTTLETEPAAAGRLLNVVVACDQVLGRPLYVNAGALVPADSTQLRRLELKELRWGGSTGSGECELGSEAVAWRLDLKRLRLDEIWETALPFANVWPATPAAATPRSRAVVPAVPSSAGVPTVGGCWTGKWSAAEIILGDDALLQEAKGRLAGTAGRITSSTFAARYMTAADEMRVEYGQGGPGRIEVSVPDLEDLLTAVTAPLRARPPASSSALNLLTTYLKRAHALVGSGALKISGHLDEANGQFSGDIELRNATLRDAPWLVKILALKTGKKMRKQPFIELLAIKNLEASSDGIAVQDLTLTGAGLVDRLNLEKASYRAADETIEVAGSYWGAGFEVIGPRRAPLVFLKENALIRAVSTDAEADFNPE